MRLFALAALLLPWFAATARADLCPPPPASQALAGSQTLAGIDSEARLSFLLHAMDDDAARLHTWSLIWGTTYAVATAAQVVAIPLVQGGARVDLTAGGIAAAVGSASLYLLPLRITRAAHFSPSDLAGSDRCEVLAQVEKRFFDTAKIDRLSGSWIAHAGNVAINAALALILGVGYGRWTSAAISAAVGLAVGEANLLTQPHGLVSAEQKYLAGEALTGEAQPVGDWRVALTLDRSRIGAAIVFAL